MDSHAGRRLKLAVAALLAVAIAGGGYAWWRSRQADRGADAARHTTYTCPMHPQIVRDRPGDCPICGMRLVPRPDTAATPLSGSAAPDDRHVLYWRHPMNPSVRSDRPAKDEMGMDYVPVYSEDAAGSPAVAGRATIVVPPDRRQVLGIRSEEARVSSAGGVIRAVGHVEVDESRLHHVHAKYAGFVEHLYVEAVGQAVRSGQPLLSVFSPEVIAAQEEYLVARRAQGEPRVEAVPGLRQGERDLLEASRQRLRYLDVSAEEIAALERNGSPLRAPTIRADRGGYVTEKNAFHGMRVTPGERLLTIADLSVVWVLADVLEKDMSAVRLGSPARVTLPNTPGVESHGRVTLLSPLVSEATRTAQARVEVANPRGVLRPGMFADVFFETSAAMAVVIPETAVVRTGERTLAFVDHGDGRLEPREISLGARVEGGYQVLSGIAAGERVVTSATFLLDSEASLKAAIQGMSSPGGR